MTGITLREAREADAQAVFAMLRALAEEVGEATAFVSTLEDVRRDGLGPEPRYETIVAELDGRPAGLMTFFATYSTHKGRPCLYVDNFYVAPEARGRGLARRLMARVCRLAETRDCCRVELKVRADNPAKGFYEAVGMHAIEEVPYTIRDQAMRDLAAED
jgi:GNAT superfamily N-acetyltransferase